MQDSANTTRSAPPPDRATRADGLLYPLDLVYERAGIAAPEVTAVSPEGIPHPYRSLLVHRDDMTPTLERHYGGRVVLRPLSVFTSGSSYFRRVLLVGEQAGQPVEMGAIRMELDAFDAPIRRKINDQLSSLEGDAADVVLETPGGSGEAAEDIVRLIRRRFESVGVIVPGTAKSAGTILALAGDEILMGPESALGPIDAQISQKGKVFSADALLAGMDQIKREISTSGTLSRPAICGHRKSGTPVFASCLDLGAPLALARGVGRVAAQQIQNRVWAQHRRDGPLDSFEGRRVGGVVGPPGSPEIDRQAAFQSVRSTALPRRIWAQFQRWALSSLEGQHARGHGRPEILHPLVRFGI